MTQTTETQRTLIESTTINNLVTNTNHTTVLLTTPLVKVKTSNGTYQIPIVGDTTSSYSFITHKAVQRLPTPKQNT